jgi:soluble lytic murein transglycosylase-like protein
VRITRLFDTAPSFDVKLIRRSIAGSARGSRYNPLAISKAGAAGLGQLMPGTARDLGVPNRFDPAANLFGAAKYLRQMLDKFGVVHLALAAYNAGPGAVERAGGIPRNGETPAYVRDVLRHWRF